VHKIFSEKVKRKKYLKKSGKSMWMKNKTKNVKTFSMEISTKSSDGYLDMGVISSKPTSVSFESFVL
jgi:hypothetical protein